MSFDHERLDCYRLATEVARWLRGTKFPRGDAALRKQAVRATDSMVLNIAEGASRRGDAAKNHFEIALGSAGEVSAVLDLVALEGGADNQDKLRRVGAMLAVLRR
jgi:four helix bundle protein